LIKKNISIVIPCYNEEKNLHLLTQKLFQETTKLKNYNFNFLFVDDGSSDNTFEVIENLSKTDKMIKGIKLSRNFGSHIAISAGIENVENSDSVIVISADLQEPPEIIKKLLIKWNEGFDVVWSLRNKRSQSLISKFFSFLFYKLFVNFSDLKNYPKKGPSSFFLLDKKVFKNWKRFKESNRMVLGMVSWMGFNQTSINYDQNTRYSGKSSFNFFKLLKLAIDSFIAYSFAPIRLISLLGIIISSISFFYAIYLIIENLIYKTNITGWTSLMVIVLFLGGVQLITLGIIGEYVWRGVDESRNRPLYLISKKINFKE